MNISILIFSLIMIVVIGIIATTLTIAIKQNFNVSQQLRTKLMEKLKQLPFYRMLSRRNIDANKYLHDIPINDIENQLQSCSDCATNKKCEEVLVTEGNTDVDYSFCPNDEYFKQSKHTKNSNITSSTDQDND
jgi:uncharacterized protein DUF6455